MNLPLLEEGRKMSDTERRLWGIHMDSTHKEHFRNMVGNRMMQ